jgi:hypothetical protein
VTYALVSDVLDYLGIDDTSGISASLIEGHIAAAQMAIDNYCHRNFEAPDDETRYYDALGDHIRGRALFLDDEMCRITSITLADGTVLASTDYVTIPRNVPPFTGIRLKHSSAHNTWRTATDWEGAIEIEGGWAYSVEAPAVIHEACVSLAAFYYRQKDQPFTDVTAVEAGVVVRPIGIPAHIKAMLDNGYRKP